MLQSVMAIMGVLSSLMRDAGNPKIEAIGGVLNIGVRLFNAGNLTAVELQQLENTVKALVAEDREPTEAEWAALRDMSDSAHDRIQAVDLDLSDADGDGGGDTPSDAAESPTSDAPGDGSEASAETGPGDSGANAAESGPDSGDGDAGADPGESENLPT